MIHLRPSAAYRWSNCAAAPTFEDRAPPQPDSDAAREGTCAAWVAECVLKGDAHSALDMEGETHANGWLVTPDMVHYVQQYIDMIQSRGGVTTAEQFVRLNEFIAGTFDSSTSASGPTLFVDDLKYGFRIVEIFENPQLIIYGAAELMRLNNPAITQVQLGIYQPRAFHPDGIYRTWTVTVPQLMELAGDLIERGRRCQSPNPIATPGRHCGDCRAIIGCAAHAHSVYAAFQLVESHQYRKMTGTELSAELDFVALAETMIKARKSAVETEAETRLRSGEHVPAYHIKERFGDRRFKYPADVVRAMTGVDPTEKKMITPAALERAGVPPDVVNALSERPTIGFKLQRIANNAFRKAFGDGK